MMKVYAYLIVTVLHIVLDIAVCDLDPCEDGYEIAKEYTDCWRDSKFVNKTAKMSVPQAEYTAKDVEEYATHMCRVVKPEALKCLRRQLSRCTNIKKILEMADNSGGTCDHYELDDHFKHSIIEHLPSVRSDSPCFNISDTSNCYDNAATTIRRHGVPISKFHYEADKFFAKIWECQVRLYKSNSKVCPNWQLPMLLSLQDMAMPTLFGMKLTEEHVSMLEFNNEESTTRTTPTRPPKADSEVKSKFFILLRVLAQRPEAVDGDVVIQVNAGEGVGDIKANVKHTNVIDKKKNKVNKGQKARKEKTWNQDINNQMIN
ncbi:unnamed protein product [Candidula unifasciata]|uniref:Secreted protein n=1 Tax=Candidula unifasciata TaxID=100452 RepID=A0A8S3ZIW7_9EUPU|nr:unnamed protein product [Candidula unifasciata]